VVELLEVVDVLLTPVVVVEVLVVPEAGKPVETGLPDVLEVCPPPYPYVLAEVTLVVLYVVDAEVELAPTPAVVAGLCTAELDQFVVFGVD